MSLAAMSSNKNARDRVYRAISLGAASLAIVIGSFMVGVWHSHSEWLWQTIPELFQMKFNTALAFIAGGVGLFAASRDQNGYACGAGCVVCARARSVGW